MKKNLWSILLILLLWPVIIPSRVDASYVPCNGCRKANELSHVPISYHICGPSVPEAIISVCNLRRRKKRKAIDLLLGKAKANQFLSSQHVAKRSAGFTMNEECCNEGCRHEEIREYCQNFG